MHDDASRPLPESSLRLWFAMLAGPLAWTAHLLLSYGLVPIACDTGWSFLFAILTAAAALISVAGAIVSRRLPRGGDSHTNDVAQSNATERMRFIAYAGFLSGIFFTIIILIQGSPTLFLDPCTWGK